MSEKILIQYIPKSEFAYSHLDPIVDFLLAHGNELACDYRWGSNKTNFFCDLKWQIDFDLIENNFILPDYIQLNRNRSSIQCDKTWAEINGGSVFIKKPAR